MAIFYASQNMPEDDSSASGGDINSGIRIAMETLDTPTTITAYSASNSDINTVSVYGRNTAGVTINETINVSGTGTSDPGSTTFSGIFKATLAHATGYANITVSGTSQNVVGTIPIYESGFRAPFYKATASAGSSKDFYEKIFIKNVNASTTIYDSKIVQIADTGLSSQITFAIEEGRSSPTPFAHSGIGVTGEVANRLTVPSSYIDHFGSGTSGIWPSGSGNLGPTSYQGVWLKLSLDAGAGALNSFYQIEQSGRS